MVCFSGLSQTNWQPTCRRAAASSSAVGTLPVPRKKPQALLRGPTVMSNAPSVWRLYLEASGQQTERFGRERNRLLRGQPVDEAPLAVRAIGREQPVEPAHLVEGRVHRGLHPIPLTPVQDDREGRTHRAAALPQPQHLGRVRSGHDRPSGTNQLEAQVLPGIRDALLVEIVLQFELRLRAQTGRHR